MGEGRDKRYKVWYSYIKYSEGENKMMKGFLLGALSVALFAAASVVEHSMLEQVLQMVGAGVAVLCFFVVTKESKK
jgi:hypothetical protein